MLNTTLPKFRVILLVVLAISFGIGGMATAQPKAEVLDRWAAEDARIARLAGLARLWGAVKFFHPYLAYKEVDWDKALIETISRVNAAKTPEEYNAAINHLLSFLNDKNTSAEIVKETKPKAIKAVQQNNFNPAPSRTATVAMPRSVKDNAYPEMEFPNSEYRLLALFRFWNVINYFFPYKHLIDKPWDDILSRYIPKFEANKDALDYQTTMFELAAETQDSHVGVRGATKFIEKLGMFLPPISLKYVENQTVVTSVLEEKTGLKVGDVILAVDGEPVKRRREYFGRFFAASTPQALALRVNYALLSGSKDSQLKLNVRGTDGNTREVVVSRSLSAGDPKLFQASQRTTPVVQVLPSGFGYVDLERLTVAEVERMFETIKNTPATIFDMRGYPHGTAWEIAPRLTEKKDVSAALFSRPIWEGTSLNDEELTNTNFTFAQKLPKAKGDAYKGKVVMLINEDAISQAEHTCLFFESATDVTFIGTPERQQWAQTAT